MDHSAAEVVMKVRAIALTDLVTVNPHCALTVMLSQFKNTAKSQEFLKTSQC